uniref:Uncharacterized protein n=1 Tax=Arundo donax TaxID=35708 RepID=A0A0A9E574_ARUDO
METPSRDARHTSPNPFSSYMSTDTRESLGQCLRRHTTESPRQRKPPECALIINKGYLSRKEHQLQCLIHLYVSHDFVVFLHL